MELIGFIVDLFSHRAIWHPRVLPRVLIGLTILGFYVIAYRSGRIPLDNPTIVVVYSGILALYLPLAYCSARGPMGIARVKLTRLRRQMRLGLSWDVDNMFDRRPFYIRSSASRCEYALLHAAYLRERGEDGKAYQVLSSINEDLFPDEKERLYLSMAGVLADLGSMSRARLYLEKVDGETNPAVLAMKSRIAEMDGDLDAATSYLKRAVDSLTTKHHDRLRLQIYNDYGRIRKTQGNFRDAIFFYTRSAAIARELGETRLMHVPYQNTILSYHTAGDRGQAYRYLKEYRELVDGDSLSDALEIYNFGIDLHRQIGGIEHLAQTIYSGYSLLRRDCTGDKGLALEISILRALANARGDLEVTSSELDTILCQIARNVDCYLSMDMPARYRAVKETLLVLDPPGSLWCYPGHERLLHVATEYMRNKALLDLDDLIGSLHEFEIYARCELEKERLFVLTRYRNTYDFRSIHKLMQDIRDIYYRNGLVIEALDMDLNIVDECCAAQNWEGGCIRDSVQVVMREQLALVEKGIARLKDHPNAAPMLIRVAFYYCIVGEITKAREYLNRFEDVGISPLHYASWIQNYYGQVKQVVSGGCC